MPEQVDMLAMVIGYAMLIAGAVGFSAWLSWQSVIMAFSTLATSFRCFAFLSNACVAVAYVDRNVRTRDEWVAFWRGVRGGTDAMHIPIRKYEDND